MCSPRLSSKAHGNLGGRNIPTDLAGLLFVLLVHAYSPALFQPLHSCGLAFLVANMVTANQIRCRWGSSAKTGYFSCSGLHACCCFFQMPLQLRGSRCPLFSSQLLLSCGLGWLVPSRLGGCSLVPLPTIAVLMHLFYLLLPCFFPHYPFKKTSLTITVQIHTCE